MPRRDLDTCRGGCRGVAAAQRRLSVPQGNAVLEDEDASPTQDDGKRPGSLLSPLLLVWCHRGWPMPCCSQLSRLPRGECGGSWWHRGWGRVRHGGAVHGWVGQQGDGDGQVAVGTPGQAAGDDWCSGTVSLPGWWTGGSQWGSPGAGCRRRGRCSALLLAASCCPSAGRSRSHFQEERRLPDGFFHCFSPKLPRRSLSTSPKTSPCAIPTLVSVGRGCEAVPLGLFSSSSFSPHPRRAFTSRHVRAERSSCPLPRAQVAEERWCHPRAASCQAAWVGFLSGRGEAPGASPPLLASL